MKRTLIAAIVACACAGVAGVSGCEEKSPTVKNAVDATKKAAASATDAAKSTAGDVAAKASAAWESAQKSLLESAGPKIEEFKKQIASLKEKGATVPAAVKPAFDSAVAEAEKQFGSVEGLMGKLKSATGENFDALKKEFEPALAKLGEAIKAAMSKMGG